MARKIRLVGASICVLIFLVAFVMVCKASANSVAIVRDALVTAKTDTTVSFSWKNVDDVDGYEIYKKTASDKDFSLSCTVKGSESNKATVKDLKPFTDYEFYVVAYRGKGEDKLVSRKHYVLADFTLPNSPKITADSTMKGELSLSWNEIKKCAGYEVEYTLDKDKKSFTVKGAKTTNKTLTGLVPDATYSAKVRCFVQKDGKKIYGAWSKADSVVISKKQIQSKKIDPKKPMIALTFDDGPDFNGSSAKILNVLEEYNARATFFMLGRNAAQNPENVKRKVKLGMEIGNHTYDHENYGANITDEDITKANEAINEACGQYPTCFRSPGGMTNDNIRSVCKKSGMPLYYWSLDTEDWNSRDADTVYNFVMNNVSDGDIILMHEIYGSTADAVEKMVPELISKGYQLVTCEELVQYKAGKSPEAGIQYVDADTINNDTN